MDRELLQDSDGVNESFWDGLGVEFEARYFLEGIWGCGGFRWIENFSRIKMVVARASGMDLASSLKRNTFLTLGWCLRPVLFRGGDPQLLFWGGTMGGCPPP